MMSTITDGNVYRVSVSGYSTITCSATFTDDTEDEGTIRVRLIS